MSWADALGWTAARLRAIIDRHGPDAVAFYGSGQLDSEAGYLAVKLFKGSIGTNNTDSNSRLCMASAVAGYRTSLGADGPPCCYADIDLSDCLVVWGSNMAEAFPVTFDRVMAHLRAHPGTELIVVDPRRTNTATCATLYVPVAPGGDIALLNAVGKRLLQRDAFDVRFVAQHTRGFAEYSAFLAAQDMGELCAAAGVDEEIIDRIAGLIAGATGFLSFYCMGLNQSTVGMWKNNSLINLHLLTGQIGRPGSVSPKVGLTAVEMFRALEKGQLKALWIAGTNPAVSLPDLHHVRRALSRAQLVVVQDAYHPTETTRFADVLLPAAQWGEKEWTSTNSERMVAYSPRLFPAPGEALP